MLTASIQGYRISPLQERVWRFTQSMVPAASLRLRARVLIEGELDHRRLEQAIQQVVQLHECLRTRFDSLPGVPLPLQVVDDAVAVNLSARSAAENEPVVEFHLSPMGQDVHLLTVVGSAENLDFFSTNLLVTEIARAYNHPAEYLADGEDTLQYPDVAEWLHEMADDEDAASVRRYWKDIGSRIHRSFLPVSGEPVATNSVTIGLPSAVANKILSGEREGRWAAEDFLLAAWRVCLQHFSPGCESIGVASDGRADERLWRAMGPLTRYLPIVSVVDPHQPFLDALRSEKAGLQEARKWQDYFTWSDLLKSCHSEHKIHYFAHAFDYVVLAEDASSPSAHFRLEDLEGNIDQAGLRLSVQRASDAIKLSFTGLSSLYSEQTLSTMVGALATLLASAADDPTALVGTMARVDGRTQRRLLQLGRGAEAAYQDLPPIHEQIARQAKRTPAAPAVVYEGAVLTYSELDRWADSIAYALSEKGVGPESIVGIAVERSLELVAALLGVLKAGAAYLPLDTAYPVERLEYMVSASRAGLILSSSSAAEIVSFLRADSLNVAELRAVTPPADWRAPEPSPLSPAYIIYTSGSTGRPKGVMVTHGAIRNHMAWMQDEFPIEPVDRVLQKTAFSFDASVWEFYAPLLAGGALIMARPGGQADAEYLVAVTREEKISVLQLVPTQLRMMLEQPGLEECRELKRIYCGGEALPIAAAKLLKQRLPQVALYNLYGPTEATIDATCGRCDEAEGQVTAPIGRPVANVRAYVLDADMQLVPVGVRGELYLGGVALARGYLDQPGMTAARFVPDPFSAIPGERLYRTGDQVSWRHDGQLDFFGRQDHQVKFRGFRVELGEIESSLLEHPDVKQSAVILREDVPGQAQIVAYVVPGEEAASPSDAELRAWLKTRLPEYMVPTAHVLLKKLPLTPNGKVNREALEPPAEAESSSAYVAPRNPEEAKLCAIFSEVLKRGQVGVNDNFFDLGGHSLIATQVISRIRSEYSIDVPLRTLFQSPTVSELAACVRAAVSKGATEIAPLGRTDRNRALPLSHAQKRLWFLDQLEPGSDAYNMTFSLRFLGPLDAVALKNSLGEIVRRHEVLRTRLPERDGLVTQQVLPPETISVDEIDLRSLPETERTRKADALRNAIAREPFDLQAGPLLRIKLLQLGNEEHLLLVIMHHIVSDGWSLTIMAKELTELYSAFHHGRASFLPPLKVQYADYAAWQQQPAQQKRFSQQLGYWRSQLAELPILDLPTDYPRPAVSTYSGGYVREVLEPALANKLKALSKREGATLFMTLLTSFQLLLARYTGQWDVAVGTDVANRTTEETEKLIGFFVNTLVLRARLDRYESFLSAVRQVREVTLSGYANQDVPFESVVEQLAPERSLNRNPLCQVLFTLQNTPGYDLQLGDLKIATEPAGNGSAKFDLNLFVFEQGDELRVGLEYSNDIFSAQTGQRLLTHWKNLLQAVALHPEQPVWSLPLMDEEETVATVLEGTLTAAKDASDFVTLFRQQCERNPHAIAAVDSTGEISYTLLNHRANQLAAHLRQRGVKPEDVVALLLDRSIDFLVSMIAAFKVGAAYLPLDPNHPPVRHLQVLRQSRARVLIVNREMMRDLRSQTIPAGLENLLFVEAEQISSLTESGADLSFENGPQNAAYVIYTSGSTGVPKGAVIHHQGMVNHLFAKVHDLTLTASDVVAQTASQAFDISVWQFLSALVVGGKVQIVPNEVAADPQSLLALVQKKQVTILELVPSMLRAVVEEVAARPGASSLPSLRYLLSTGEALSHDLAQRWLNLYPEVPLVNAYGPTECSDDVSHHLVPKEKVAPAGSVPIGRAIENTQLYVLDSELQPVPSGVVGELYVGGAGVGRGYLNDPLRTAQVMLPHPFAKTPGQRLYRTGDLVRTNALGELLFLGRVDHQVKLRGHRIELGEIEAALERDNRVRQALVTLFKDNAGQERIVAYVAAEENIDSSNLREALGESLPAYMNPANIIALREFPLTPNGKIDRRALPEPGLDHRKPYVAPQTPTEEAIAAIWQEVLKVEKVSTQDDFFELGGHSLLATQIISRLRSVLDVDIPLRAMFEVPTVAYLAKVADQVKATGSADGVSGATAFGESGSLAGIDNLSEEEIDLLLAMEDDSAHS